VISRQRRRLLSGARVLRVRGRAHFVLLGLVLVAACGRHPDTNPSPAGSASGRSSEVLTRAELRNATGSMFDVVTTLRPAWMRLVRYGSFEIPPMVYLDELWIGRVTAATGTDATTEMLRQAEQALRAYQQNCCVEVRYFTPGKAATRFGSTNPVIQLITR
jgi:hypothetical protein